MTFLYSVFLVLILSLVLANNVFAVESGESQTRQQGLKFEAQIVKTVRLNYLLFLPEDYGKDAEKQWPLLLFLHGMGERGDDLERVKVHGPPKIVEQREDFPFIVVSPQCPGTSRWTGEVEALNALLDDVVAKHSVDEDRIYLTGLSMGGFGTWSLATMYPERFAAIAPICGGGDPKKANAIKDIPVWVFHGAKDETVPPERSEEMVNALKEVGADVQYTLYPDAGHDSWTETYDNPKLYEWFLKHKRKKQ
ncbi:prolyl oligopeptidase family serine peptidase [Candidatus Poribacteria bacterium]